MILTRCVCDRLLLLTLAHLTLLCHPTAAIHTPHTDTHTHTGGGYPVVVVEQQKRAAAVAVAVAAGVGDAQQFVVVEMASIRFPEGNSS